ncbi:MAG TPA: hypothetical protein VK590_04220 [Saprospiraceae bacterium]|nr:hypothetical protein [Saprospiraceae bacterium]
MAMPEYAQNALYGQGQGGGFGSGMGADLFGSGIGGILNGLFGNAGKPYHDAGKELDKYFPQAQQWQQPFYNAGTGAIPGFQNWLNGMQDPSKFINGLMDNYKESPFAHYQQQQGMRAAQNVGSASGMSGSTPLMQQAQQNAQNISGQDMNQWLQNALGVNSQYGAGLNSLMGMGQHSSDSLSQMFSDYMNNKANLAYGEGAAKQGQQGSLFGGLGGLAGSLLFL